MVKKIIMYSVIIVIIFGAGVFTGFQLTKTNRRAVIAEYELKLADYAESDKRKDELISGIGEEITQLQELDGRREEITRRKDGEILALEEVIRRLGEGTSGEQDNYNRLKDIHDELARRLRQNKEE